MLDSDRRARSPQRMLALLVPVGTDRPCALAMVDDTAAAISDAVGARLFDELLTGAVAQGLFVVYGPDAATVPDNPRAALLAARLGYRARDVLRRMRGDIVVPGLAPGGSRDTDVPTGVLTATAACGLAIDSGGVRRGRGLAVYQSITPS